jgi:hypothetical protein
MSFNFYVAFSSHWQLAWVLCSCLFLLDLPWPAKDLHALRMHSWDRCLQWEVKRHFPDDFLNDLRAFVTYLGTLWDWIHVWPLLSFPLSETNEKESIDRGSLHLMGLKPIYDPYRRILSQFQLPHRSWSIRALLYEERALYTGCTLHGEVFFRAKKNVPSTLNISFIFCWRVLTSCFSGKLCEYQLPREWLRYRRGHEDEMFREKAKRQIPMLLER